MPACEACGRIIVTRRRGKTQPRRFDYAEVRRLRWVEGVSVAELARRFGVTTSAIYYACSAHRRAYTKAKHREVVVANQAARRITPVQVASMGGSR